MALELQVVLFGAAVLGMALTVLQTLLLRRHLAEPPPAPATAPGISILKPLCGVDDDLEDNLARFAALDWPRYEVVLGVRDPSDPAWPVARAAARRWPGRFRAVLQRGDPGLNPKVNQLITLARAARHDILVVSDSNVRVRPGYLAEIAGWLEDPGVGLVTHPIAGVGEERLGSAFDNLHLAGAISAGMVAAKRIAGKDVVVGKSMALRRRDLKSLGGFEVVKDVLAEDYVMGVLMLRTLGKRVVVARRPVENVSRRRSVRDFAGRYARWAVLQRRIVGPGPYSSQALLNPVLFGTLAFAADPAATAGVLLGAVCAGKALLDAAAARALRPDRFGWRWLALAPAKDLVLGAVWAQGLFRDTVSWRGNRLRVLGGTRIERTAEAQAEGALAHG